MVEKRIGESVVRIVVLANTVKVGNDRRIESSCIRRRVMRWFEFSPVLFYILIFGPEMC